MASLTSSVPIPVDTWLASTHGLAWVVYYLAAAAGVTLLALLAMPKPQA